MTTIQALSTTVVVKEQKRDDAYSDRDERKLGGYVGRTTKRDGSEQREGKIPPSSRKVAEFRGWKVPPSRVSLLP